MFVIFNCLVWPGAQTQEKSGSPKGEGANPAVGDRRVVGRPKFRVFFPSPATKFVLFSPLWGLLVDFWWCLKRRGAQMCTFGVLRVSFGVHLWDDNEGTVHRIPQREGGEQGDALMPLLFALGQHEALQAVSRQLRPDERLFAFLDDVYLTSKPDRVGACYTILEEELRVHACIRIHLEKTKVWNQAGLRPPVCDVLERLARIEDPTARVQDSQREPRDQSSGVAFGTPSIRGQTFGEDVNQAPGASRQNPTGSGRPVCVVTPPPLCMCANYLLRVVRPSAAVNFAETHDRAVWQCLANILRIDLSECSGAVQDAATLPFTLGGLGLRKATRVSGPAHWASWADCLPMIHARHPLVATVLLHHLEGAAVVRLGRLLTDW